MVLTVVSGSNERMTCKVFAFLTVLQKPLQSICYIFIVTISKEYYRTSKKTT